MELLLEAGALVDVQEEVSVGVSVPYLSNRKLDCVSCLTFIGSVYY